LTRRAREDNVRKAVEQIDRLDFVRGETVIMHIEDMEL